MCQLREHLARIFFPAHCTCMNFFWHDGLVQEFFSYAYALAGYFFQNHPPPPPSEVKWSAPNTFIIQHIDNKAKFEEKILSTSFSFLHSLVNMLKFTYIVGYTSCGPTYIESFMTIFGQCING